MQIFYRPVFMARNAKIPFLRRGFLKVARLTGLEPATLGVTGRYSNQLSYNRAMRGYLQIPPAPVNRKKHLIPLSYLRICLFLNAGF